jgi:hypothetical protein
MEMEMGGQILQQYLIGPLMAYLSRATPEAVPTGVPQSVAPGAPQLRPATQQPMGGNGVVLRDGEGATPDEIATTRVGRWMSPVEHEAMTSTGRVQAPYNGAGATHITVPPNPLAFRPPPQSTMFVEFNVPNSQLRVHDPNAGWGRVWGRGSLEARLAASKGLTVPSSMPPAFNIQDTTP